MAVEGQRLDLTITGLASVLTEQMVHAVMAQYGPVLSCKLQPNPQLESESIAQIGMPAANATWVLTHLDKQIPQGLSQPVNVTLFGQPSVDGGGGGGSSAGGSRWDSAGSGGGGGGWSSGGGKGDGKAQDDNLYIKGLPAGLTNDSLKQIFSQYCTVVSCKVLPMVAGRPDAAGFVRTAGAEQAKWLLDNLNNRIPQGLAAPVVIKPAGQNKQDEGKGEGKGKGKDDEGDWTCSSCGNLNFRRRDVCNKCQAPKPDDASGGGGGWSGGGKGGKDSKGKGKGKDSKGKGKGGGKGKPANTNMYIKGLPIEMTDVVLAQIFGQYGVVHSCKVLAATPGKNSVSGFVRMAEEDAEWVVMNMNGGTPEGMHSKISVCIADDGKGAGKGGKDSKNMELQCTEVQASDNLFVRGLPQDITDERLKDIFAQYGSVVSTKVLPNPEPHRPFSKACGFVRLASTEEAKNIIDLLNNQIPMGLNSPLTVKYCGDGVPLVKAVCKSLEQGERMYYGTVTAFDLERKSAFIYCDELYWMCGSEIYCHKTVLERGLCGPGDTAVFFIHWKGDTPQAASPMMRIACECTETEKKFAMKGWFKGIADPEKGFGFIECAELKMMLNRDVYVKKEIASATKPGWVSFNCRLAPDRKDGKETLLPMCTGLEGCIEDWKAIPGDLSNSRTIEKGKGKGASAKGEPAQLALTAGGCGGKGGASGGGMDKGGKGGAAASALGCGSDSSSWDDWWNWGSWMPKSTGAAMGSSAGWGSTPTWSPGMMNPFKAIMEGGGWGSSWPSMMGGGAWGGGAWGGSASGGAKGSPKGAGRSGFNTLTKGGELKPVGAVPKAAGVPALLDSDGGEPPAKMQKTE